TFEPSFGVFRWWELGAYVETSFTDTFRYEGVKLRSKFVTPSSVDPHWRFGVNLELAYEHGKVGGELRPIISFENDRWLLALNPIVDLAAGVLEPAAST